MGKMNYRSAATRSTRLASGMNERIDRAAGGSRTPYTRQAGDVLRAMPGSLAELSTRTGLEKWQVRKALDLLSSRDLCQFNKPAGMWERKRAMTIKLAGQPVTIIDGLRWRERYERGDSVDRIGREAQQETETVREWLLRAGTVGVNNGL